jgi:hypothetical protein
VGFHQTLDDGPYILNKGSRQRIPGGFKVLGLAPGVLLWEQAYVEG